MRLLIVAATPLETHLLRRHFEFRQDSPLVWKGKVNEMDISMLHTGIGMTNTALHLGYFLGQCTVDVALNIGIAGSYDHRWSLGTIVEIVEDTFAELGAEYLDTFYDLEKMGFPLMQVKDIVYYNTLKNPLSPLGNFPIATAITANTVHGQSHSISLMRSRWNKQIESMEGAAFFQAMLFKEIPFRALRGISNYVEIRELNNQSWRIREAAEEVQKAIIQLLAKGYHKHFFDF